jgi:LysR family transcriptional regulator, cyn operon transcriptional activator
MNLRHLRTFVAIVECGGIHRASARLNLSQPAASRQIHALEADLGVPLFDRIGRRVQLTSEGEDLLRRSRRLLAEAEALTERAVALKKGEFGILRIGATPQVMENTLAPFLEGYGRHHPGVEVQLVEEGGTTLVSRLDHGDIHLALMAVDNERFQWRLLFPVCDLAVLSEKHRFCRRRTLDVSELADEPLLLLRGGFASRDWFDDACRIAHIRPRVLLESAAPHTAIALAGAGYGVAVVPSTVVISRDRVRAVPLVQRGSALAKWLRVAWEPQRSLALHAQRFIEKLVVDCERHYPGREFTRHLPPVPRPKSR